MVGEPPGQYVGAMKIELRPWPMDGAPVGAVPGDPRPSCCRVGRPRTGEVPGCALRRGRVAAESAGVPPGRGSGSSEGQPAASWDLGPPVGVPGSTSWKASHAGLGRRTRGMTITSIRGENHSKVPASNSGGVIQGVPYSGFAYVIFGRSFTSARTRRYFVVVLCRSQG